MLVKLEDVCNKATSNIMQKNIADHKGAYKIFGATGYIGAVDFYDQEEPYVAIVKDGAGIGRTFLLPEKTSVINTMQYLLPKGNIIPEYLYYVVQFMHLEKYFTGSTIPHIYYRDYKNEIFNLVPIDQQIQIVKKLDKINELIDNKEKQMKKIDMIVKSRFIEMFGDFDLSLRKLEWEQIKKLGIVVGGATPKTSIKEYWNGSFNWFTPADLNGKNLEYVHNSERKITQKGINSCSLQKLPVNTVLLTSRAPIGKVAIAGVDCYCNQGFKNIVCGQRILPKYLYYLLKYNTEFLDSLGRGATFKEISKSIVENIKIPVPEIDLQNEFICFAYQTDKSKLAIQKSIEKLEILKKSLMQKYFG